MKIQRAFIEVYKLQESSSGFGGDVISRHQTAAEFVVPNDLVYVPSEVQFPIP